MRPRFDHYVGIDYSGAGNAKTRTGSLRVYIAEKNEIPVSVETPYSKSTVRRNWNRAELHQWLAEALRERKRVVVGMDHGFSFPESYMKRYRLNTWDHFLEDFVKHWPTHLGDNTVNDLRAGSKRIGSASELRLTEKWTSSAKSVFQFDVQGSVAKSTHCGIPYLHNLRQTIPALHFWPFDGFKVPRNRSVVAEVFPSLFRNRYDRESRTVDQQDAYSVCRWLQETDRGHGLDRYFQPPIAEKAKATVLLEGWILGVT